MAEPILAAQHITKQFPGVRALDDVDMDLAPGEVHALVGENGAGKSTLVKILGGQLRPTSGAILLRGREIHFDTPLQAQAAGVSVINQEFHLVPQLTVAENIFIGREPKRGPGLIDWNSINRRSAAVLYELGLNVSPTQRVEYLTVADRQLVEIAKSLARDFSLIVMDEPTAALNAAEVERLFEIIAGLKQRGAAVLYVSHRLNEVFRIADRVTVLRDGRKVGTRAVAEVTEHDVISMMLGRALAEYSAEHEPAAEGRTPALSARNLAVPGVFSAISFDLHYGEVLGCAGLIGSGRSELMRALFGLLPHSADAVSVDGRPVRLTEPAAAIRQGVFLLPEDRKVEGIYPDLSVVENLFTAARRSATYPAKTMLDERAEQSGYTGVKESLAIRAYSPDQMITTLSGGNQQKVLLGRALISEARILLLNEPTRGVDVGTKVEIHALIRRLAHEGKAVLVSSSDVPELVAVSDRCMVLSAGRVSRILPLEHLAQETIVAAALGRVGEAGAPAPEIEP